MAKKKKPAVESWRIVAMIESLKDFARADIEKANRESEIVLREHIKGRASGFQIAADWLERVFGLEPRPVLVGEPYKSQFDLYAEKWRETDRAARKG